MTRFHSGLRPLAAALLCGTALLWGAVAAHATENQPTYNPPIYMAHGIEYMSGGIGSDEAQLMETVSPRWPAAFEFSIKDHKGADFAANVRITVRDSSGAALLDHVVSGGPFMVARLDPGNYEVEAQLGSQTLKQPLRVMPGTSTKATFVWPAGTDMAAAGTHSVQ